MRTQTVIAILALFSIACPLLAKPTSFYVSPNGNDANSGTRSMPFKTLERARDAVRAAKKSGALAKSGFTVWIRGGKYEITNTFALTREDGGRDGAPVVYRGYGDVPAEISGGRRVNKFVPVTDPSILRRLDQSARGKVLVANLREEGIDDFGKMTPRGFGRDESPAGLELFFQDRRMPLARWPNSSWEMIAGVPENLKGRGFEYSGERPERWKADEDVWMHGFWSYDWADSYVKIKSIDTKAHQVVAEDPQGVYGYKTHGRYCVLNALEELDMPGEWYLDRTSGFLYFWPPGPLERVSAYVSVISKPLVSVEGASHVELLNLTFEYCRGSAIVLQNGDHDTIVGCTVFGVGNTGVNIAGGTSNRVEFCTILRTGDGCVQLAGGDRKTLTRGDNIVTNCHLCYFGEWDETYHPAVRISGVGNTISHNRIHDSPHCAILLSGNDHTIEYNDIYRVALDTNDVGAFYLGRDFTERGNVVRYNYFHDLGEADLVQAVYLDDCACGTLVYGNLFDRVHRAVMIGGGRDNVVKNNIFVDCKIAVHVDARGTNWAKGMFNRTDGTIIDRMRDVHYSEPPYSVKYPLLTRALDDEPEKPKGNEISRNISIGCQWLELSDGLTAQLVGVGKNLVDVDPRFVDRAHGNFMLKRDSPAFKMGFERIPLDRIGPGR